MITRIFGTLLPAIYIGNSGKQWTVAGTIMEISVVGDQVLLPEGLNAYGRVSIEGSGRVECQIRLKQYESDEILFAHGTVIETAPEAVNKEKFLSTYEFAIRLPIERLYPAVAASSLGTVIRTTFLLEMVVPANVLDPNQEIIPAAEGVPAMVLAVAPLYLHCNPRQTLAQGTKL